MRDLKLPQFEAGAQLAWPPHRPIDWSSVAPVARHPGADWAVERESAQATRADQGRLIDHYAAMARQRQEREPAEAQKRGKGAAA